MFIQVIKGHTDDAAGLKAATERWQDELLPGAHGYLGITAGVADDGTSIALVRFESAEAAHANSERPEQDAWWQETSKVFTGEVTFHDCREVVQQLDGGSDDAGFVQIIEGRVTDAEAMRKLMTDQNDALLRKERPDLIGATIALHGDGRFTQAAYFTSEVAAREGERREPSPEARKAFEAEMSLLTDLTYIDLRDPWLFSAS